MFNKTLEISYRLYSKMKNISNVFRYQKKCKIILKLYNMNIPNVINTSLCFSYVIIFEVTTKKKRVDT